VADVVGMAEGTYVFELTVTDNEGAAATDQVVITVVASQNQPPVARAGNDTVIAVPSTIAWLNGSASFDTDGNLSRFVWRQVSGPSTAHIENVIAPATFVSRLQTGVYTFELTVTDNENAIARDTMTVTVVNNFRYEESLTIYPNPITVKARVRCVSDSTGDLTLRIIDMNGRFIRAVQTVKGQSYFEQELMFSDLRPGIYYLEAIIGNKKRMVQKFVKQ
ncbi:MAG TPA: T9SS type A sorting domain-containing protein, partial [Chitinophagaceae bacterium]|nr:T9SS type A sorting domain-containing protein [Chitinophagaceae bacterium]